MTITETMMAETFELRMKDNLPRNKFVSLAPLSLAAPSIDQKSSKKNVSFSRQLENIRYYRTDEPSINVKTQHETTKNFPFYSIRSSLCRFKTIQSLVDIVQNENVTMDNIVFRYPFLEGHIALRNISFHKRVFVRYTLDNWRTHFEEEAKYESSDPNSGMDRFMFAMDVSRFFHDSKSQETAMLFAIRYEVENAQYWDNNSGNDYRIDFITQRPRPPASPKLYSSSPTQIINPRRSPSNSPSNSPPSRSSQSLLLLASSNSRSPSSSTTTTTTTSSTSSSSTSSSSSSSPSSKSLSFSSPSLPTSRSMSKSSTPSSTSTLYLSNPLSTKLSQCSISLSSPSSSWESLFDKDLLGTYTPPSNSPSPSSSSTSLCKILEIQQGRF